MIQQQTALSFVYARKSSSKSAHAVYVYILLRAREERPLEHCIISIMEKLAKPQIISHIEKSVDYSVFDAKWVPCSAKFAVMGSRPRGSGVVQIYEVSSGELELVKSIERSCSIKCGTFKASSLRDRHLATGDFKVYLLYFLLRS